MILGMVAVLIVVGLEHDLSRILQRELQWKEERI